MNSDSGCIFFLQVKTNKQITKQQQQQPPNKNKENLRQIWKMSATLKSKCMVTF